MMTSECPFIYLVKLYMTISAPKSIGRCKYDDKNVLSTRTKTPGYLCTMSEMVLTSAIFNRGFVGVSSHKIYVAEIKKKYENKI